MKDKIVNALLSAKTWMPDTVIMGRIGARSIGNVRIHLNELDRQGIVVGRTREEAGARLTEWRHRDQQFSEHVPPRANAAAAKPPKPMSTTEECAAWRIAAKTVGAETPEHLLNYLKRSK